MGEWLKLSVAGWGCRISWGGCGGVAEALSRGLGLSHFLGWLWLRELAWGIWLDSVEGSL